MSRHTQNNSNIHISYGYDDIPGGGYFFQVFDDNAISEENDEGLILNEGFVEGIPQKMMMELMVKFGVLNVEHLKRVAMDMQI